MDERTDGRPYGVVRNGDGRYPVWTDPRPVSLVARMSEREAQR